MRTGTLAGDPPGFWTDDTAMAVGILRVAAAGHRLDEVAGQRLVGREFLAWFATRPPDVGLQTAAVLSTAIATRRRPRMPRVTSGRLAMAR